MTLLYDKTFPPKQHQNGIRGGFSGTAGQPSFKENAQTEQAGGFDEYDLRNVQILEKEIEMAIRAGTAKGPRPENLANI